MTETLRDFLFGPGPVAWVQQTLGLGWPGAAQVVSLLGISWGVIAALGLSLWLWGREVTYSLVGIVVLQGLSSIVLNLLFNTPRPSHPSIVRYEEIELGSFPSGHLFTTTMVWGWLYVRRCVPFPLLAAIVVAVGVSRLYLGVHFVGDLVGAVVLAAALLWLHGRLWPRARTWLGRRPPVFFTAVAALSAAAAVASVTVLFPSNPFVWHAAGVMATAGGALLVEGRRVRLEPEPAASPRRALVGTAGIVPPLVLWWMAGEEATVVAALCTAAATLWALLAAPALFRATVARPPE